MVRGVQQPLFEQSWNAGVGGGRGHPREEFKGSENKEQLGDGEKQRSPRTALLKQRKQKKHLAVFVSIKCKLC